jgi:mono/diheme cytochrome c family protein
VRTSQMQIILVAAVAAVVASGAFTTALAHEGLPSEYTYRDDVRPIFVKHCAGCHRPGGAAPMSLLSYSEAVPWANAVKMQVLGDQMPPWLPADGVGAFAHTRSLTAAEIDVLIDWTIGETPEGKPLSASEIGDIDVPAGWTMGTPELVLRGETDFVIGEEDYELSHCLVLPTATTRARVASAFEVKPGLATIVRRATIHLGDSCEGSWPLATWLPGQGSVSLSGERGYEIPAGASVAVELLYVKGWEDEGKRLTDRTELGISFSDAAQAVTGLRVSEASHTFSDSVELVAIYPDTGPDTELDAPVRVEVVLPGQAAEAILVIDDFSAQWREKYVLTEPLTLPAGTELRLSQAVVWLDVIAPTAPLAE